VSLERVLRLPAGTTRRSPGKRADSAARRAAVSAAWGIGSRSRSSVSAQPLRMLSASSSDTPGYRPFLRCLTGSSSVVSGPAVSGVSGSSSATAVILLDTALDQPPWYGRVKRSRGAKTCYRGRTGGAGAVAPLLCEAGRQQRDVLGGVRRAGAVGQHGAQKVVGDRAGVVPRRGGHSGRRGVQPREGPVGGVPGAVQQSVGVEQHGLARLRVDLHAR